jgi:acyl-CoA synthetase (AMP-forming)/AMP-acid ligase II
VYIAGALQSAGLKPGDRVAVYSPNCSALFECAVGINRAGAVYVPLNARTLLEENLYVLQRTTPTTLFFHSSFQSSIERISRECPSVRQLVCMDASSTPGVTSFEDLIAARAPLVTEFDERPDSVVGVHSTGGTTGKPKGVALTSGVWDTMAANLFAAMHCNAPPVYLVATPITHAAGTVGFCLMAQGATIHVHKQFDAAAVLAAIERHRITHLWLPPTAVYMLLAHENLRRHDYSSLQYFMYAASPMSVDKLKQCLEVFGSVMAQSFGQTEAPMYCTWLDRSDHVVGDEKQERKLASCGRPMLLTPVEIMDDAGKLLQPGQRGEIVVKGPLVMAGYHEDPQATVAAMQGAWLRTGDIGHKDEDGYVYIVDRKKQMIITGGYNVYPSEVEQVLLAHPAVQECAVIGVPDEKWGEAIKAVVKTRAGEVVGEAELIALCKERLGGIKAPKTVEFWEALPMTPVGKVDKKNIREKYWRGRDRAI